MLRRICNSWLILALLLFVPSVSADDWPQVRHNVQRTGFTLDSVGGHFRLAWIAEFPGEAIATRAEAIVADGRVFVGTLRGTLWALDRQTGQTLWKHVAGGPILHSPACSGSRVFCADAAGTLWGLDASTGAVVWRFQSRTGGFAVSPLAANGLILLGSRDGNFYAVGQESGELRWQLATDGPIRCTAAVADKAVVFASDDMHAYAADISTGRQIWKSAKLHGQSLRDYYSVVGGEQVLLRTVPVEELNDELNGGTAFLQRLAGIAGGWKELDAFFKSDDNRGTPEKIQREQEAILQRLADNPFRRTCFVLDRATGKESVRLPVLYIGGNQGCGVPATVDGAGRVVTLYRTVYSNWNLGVKPAVGIGYADLLTGKITPLRHKHGHTPPWNTFWGTSDETTALNVGGELLYLTHQGTLSSFRLRTGELHTIHGQRDTWGGLLAPTWAANEWHGPARGGVAISNDQLFWITGSRVLCIQGNLLSPSKEPPPLPFSVREQVKSPLMFERSNGAIDTPQLIHSVPATIASTKDSELHAELAREVAELLDGWPWAPLYLQMGIGSRDFFFAHPSYAVQTLAMAYPHLPQELAARARSLARDELPKCLQPDSLPLDRGRRRELFDVPPHDLTWSYHPRWPTVSHLHAVWLYGQRTDDWQAVEALWPSIQTIWHRYLREPLAIDTKQGSHLYLNRTVAGTVAYARLAERFKSAEEVNAAEQELNRLLPILLTDYRARAAMAAELLAQPTSRGDTQHNPGRKLYFHLNNHKSKLALLMDLTSELAHAIAIAAPQETTALRDFIDRLMPAYYLALEERSVHYAENFVDLPDTVHGLFLAEAHLWNAPAERLAKRADLPWCHADLYHMEKLVQAIEADRSRHASP